MAQQPTTAPAPSMLSKLRDFIDWWVDELKTMLPFSTDSTNQAFKDRLLIVMDEAQASMVLHHRGKEQTLGKIDLNDTPPHQQIVFNSTTARYVNEEHLTGIILPASQGLKRQVNFPLAAESELGHILSHQLNRLTPYPADKIYYDYRIIKRQSSKDEIVVEFVAVPKQVVNDALKVARNWGATVNFVDLASSDNNARHHYDLIHMLPSEHDDDRSGRPLFAGLLVINLLFISAIIGIQWWQQSNHESLLQQQVTAATMQASAANKLRHKIETIKNKVDFLSKKKRLSPTAMQILNEVTHLLPHGTWLERLEFHNGKIHLTGHSSQASTLIGKIEESAIFEDVTFTAPLTQDQRLSAERFQISAMLIQQVIK
ncbi:MAG: PilN domain-containing protein [Candidatus Polarisedimenticolaceae bacterium]|nr:PilN domain-containing protein [Candidatus Polarisedimenticolaceae bacterium]